MRHYLTLLCFVLSSFAVKGQYVNITDFNFRDFLQRNYPDCFNAIGQMDTTCAAILSEETLRLSGMANIDEVQYFKSLKYLTCPASGPVPSRLPASLIYLDCSMSNMTQLPLLPAGLQYLDCSYSSSLYQLPALPATLKKLTMKYCNFASINQLPAGLQYFNADNCNSINVLPSLPASLDTLSVAYCRLETLPALPAHLKYLDCSENNIRIFPSLPGTLEYFACQGGRPWTGDDDTSEIVLPLLPANLTYLNCSEKHIRVLPELPTGLTHLIAGRNSLFTLPAIPGSLLYLEFYMNSISTFPDLPNSLRELGCSRNPIGNIPALPDSLRKLHCFENGLQNLPPLPIYLNYLICDGNQLTTLGNLPATLNYLYCSGNQLTSLPALPPNLTTLSCAGNRLTELSELPATLTDLDCSFNSIYCLPKLPDSDRFATLSLRIDAGKIKCLPNRPRNLYLTTIDSLGINQYETPPLCNPTNNIHQCQSFPVMNGKVFYDNNNNGIKDANEPVKAGYRVALSNGTYSFTNRLGNYEIGADSIGNYSLTAAAPNFFNSVPSSYNYTFTNNDTLVTNDFALQPNTTIDSLAIGIHPLNWAARPGFSYAYQVAVENVGTVSSSPLVVFDYDETKLEYDSCSNPAVVNGGSSLNLAITNFAPGQQESFTGYFRLRTNAILGDSVFANATIRNTNTFAYSTTSALIGGAFDPNDKQATPQLTPTQVANGEYIDYTIRFQNTGTDTAFNVVISDTLSSDLQVATLQMIAASHSCKATVKNNIVFFEFLNILLPDSNVNEIKSHGFVSFKIKPRSTIAVNSNINNKAAIYFDYNAPVITNTAVTAIRNPTVPLPLRLMSFTAARSTANAALLEWNTANEFNASKFVIQQSNDGRSFTNCGNEGARNGQYNFYRRFVTIPTDAVYLRLKMLDVDGRFTYSPVVLLRKQGSKAPFTILNNPVKGTLHIDVADAALYNTTARIINAQGVVVKTKLLWQSREQMDVKVLPPGIYVLQTKVGSSRFIITR